jgi:hypothetical protein
VRGTLPYQAIVDMKLITLDEHSATSWYSVILSPYRLYDDGTPTMRTPRHVRRHCIEWSLLTHRALGRVVGEDGGIILPILSVIIWTNMNVVWLLRRVKK